MTFSKRICAICSEEFELKPGKPGYANRCPDCSEEDQSTDRSTSKTEQPSDRELANERKKAMRDLLYRKDT